MLQWLKTKLTTARAKSTLRLFLITTFGLFVPGLLGWLNDLTAWAKGQGATPFPDAHGLAYLGVSAIAAGVVAVIDVLWTLVQSRPKANQQGGITISEALLAVIAGLLLVLVVKHC